jgi:hypothetical protein
MTTTTVLRLHFIIGYLILEHRTKSIICVDPGELTTAISNVVVLQKEWGYNFTHVLQTHGSSRHTESTKDLHTRFERLQAVAGDA